jgi:tetratricopeptide (TPR) repeat protein
VLIINAFIIQLNKHVDRFITRAHAPEKILTYVTSGGADWLPQPDMNVDALTSASRETYIDDLVELITDWMDSAVDQPWEPDDYPLALIYLPQVDVKAACEAIATGQARYRMSHPDLENLINRAGYQYLRFKDVRSALEVFKLNVSLFPDSWNVYDSYGEALLKNGDRESAIFNYTKAVQLNPDSQSSNAILKKLSAK